MCHNGNWNTLKIKSVRNFSLIYSEPGPKVLRYKLTRIPKNGCNWLFSSFVGIFTCIVFILLKNIVISGIRRDITTIREGQENLNLCFAWRLWSFSEKGPLCRAMPVDAMAQDLRFYSLNRRSAQFSRLT